MTAGLVLALACTTAAVPAQAASSTGTIYDGVPGATYDGVASDGAHVTFTVSPDGTLVDSYRVTYVTANTCTFVGEGDTGVWAGAPIVSGAFRYQLYDNIFFSGMFPGAQSASGTFRFDNQATPATPACDTGTVSWTATTTATPPSSGNGTGGGGGKHRFASRVALRKLSSKLVGGRITSPSSACRANRKVTLWHGKRRIALTKTKANGSFSFARSAKERTGEVRATVAVRTVRAGICTAASSTFVAG